MLISKSQNSGSTVKTAVQSTIGRFTQMQWHLPGHCSSAVSVGLNLFTAMCLCIYLPVFVDDFHGRQRMALCFSHVDSCSLHHISKCTEHFRAYTDLGNISLYVYHCFSHGRPLTWSIWDSLRLTPITCIYLPWYEKEGWIYKSICTWEYAFGVSCWVKGN